MQKNSILFLMCLMALVFINAGCSDVNNAPPPELKDGIKSVIPARGPFGAYILIGGKGFGTVQQVNFNGTKAQIETSSDTTILTRVPTHATSGPLEVISNGETLAGPRFTVDSTSTLFLTIQRVQPETARHRDTLRISGTGFLSPPERNKIFFNEIQTFPISGNDSILATTVPPNAKSGLLAIVAEQDTAIGPKFTVVQHEIENISPQSGLSGTEVTISGHDFSSVAEENRVLFNGLEAKLKTSTESELAAIVPQEASTGALSVIVRQDTVEGPVFTVQSLTITGINPTSGPVGTEVTISGTGFSATASDNTVTFTSGSAEVEAAIKSATESELVVDVPGDATTGSVYVSTYGYRESGPEFTVQQPRSMQVEVQTKGTEQDTDGYTISVEGKENRVVKPYDSITYNNLFGDEVEVSLSGAADNCRIEGENPRMVNLDNSDNYGYTLFTVDCTIDLRGKIIFESDRDNYGEIYKQNGDGSGMERITNSTDYYEKEPALSPDGLMIAFSNSKGGGKHIYVMDSDGSDVRQITDYSSYDSAPSWSPDGSKIVFVSSSNSDAQSDLLIMDNDGNNVTNITNTATDREAHPDWSPDGSKIIYQIYSDGDSELYTISTAGNNKIQLTDNSVSDTEAEWSPDGSKIAFVRNLSASGSKIHIMDSDGTNVQELTPGNGSERFPTWSPDGTKIAYSKYIDGYTHIYIYSVEFNDIISSPYTTGNDGWPHWNYK